jgi:hypothetical protein
VDRADERGRKGFWIGESQWVLGFLSGVGYMRRKEGFDPLNGLDARAVDGWLDNYCRANPLKTLAAAAAAFVQDHGWPGH